MITTDWESVPDLGAVDDAIYEVIVADIQEKTTQKGAIQYAVRLDIQTGETDPPDKFAGSAIFHNIMITDKSQKFVKPFFSAVEWFPKEEICELATDNEGESYMKVDLTLMKEAIVGKVITIKSKTDEYEGATKSIVGRFIQKPRT